MDGMQRTTARDANGRFRPGSSGNPAGKRPGTRNRATLLAELLREGEAEAIGQQMIDKALAGDAVAVRFCAERLIPRPRGRTIRLDIPEGESPAGEVVATFNAALRALNAGEITPAEAVEVSRFLDGRLRVLRAWALEQKLTRWNDPLPIPGDDGPSPLPEVALQAQAASFGRRSVAAASASASAPYPVPSPPAQRGALRQTLRRDAQGWRGAAEPYPELGEGGAAADEMPEELGASQPPFSPHPAPAKLDDVSLSLRIPPERLSKGPQAGEEMTHRGGEEMAGRSDSEFVIDDELAIAVRDQILIIPGVREAALKLALPSGRSLHSACNFEAPPLPAQPPAPPPADRSPSRTRQDTPRVISRRPGSFGPPARARPVAVDGAPPRGG
jgi:hypothetical protein